MNHQELRKRMGAYLEGDLPLAQRALFDAHLDACSECAADLRSLRETVGLLRDLPGPEVPAHLADRVVARVRDGEGHARWWDGVRAFWDAIDPARYLPPLAGAALTTALVIVGVRDLGWQIPGLSAPPAPQARVVAELGAEESTSTPRRSPPEVAAQQADRARASRMMAAAQGGRSATVEFLEPPPGFLDPPFAPRATIRAPSLMAGLAAPTPEGDLALAVQSPASFLGRYHALRPAEAQQAWLESVADAARAQQLVPRVVEGLRGLGGTDGPALADRFERAAGAVAAAAEGTDR